MKQLCLHPTSLFQALGSWRRAKKESDREKNEGQLDGERRALVLPRFFSPLLSFLPNYPEPGTG